MQVKNPKQGLFNIVETDDNLRAGIPALWHQKSTRNTTLEAKANARLERRSDKGRLEQDLMLQRKDACRWHVKSAWRHNELLLY